MRFSVGDMARIVVAMKPENQGKIVGIFAAGPFNVGDRVMTPNGKHGTIKIAVDYLLDDAVPGHFTGAMDWQLQPINPPEEPKSLTREKEMKV